MTSPMPSDGRAMSDACPACAKAAAKYDRLDARMARRGNFGIVPLSRTCKAHRVAPAKLK